MKNWKTNLAGIAAILLTASGPVLDHFFPIVGLSWSATMTSIAVLVGGAGLVAAKDGSTHSTSDEVETADIEEKVKQLDLPKP